MKYRVLIFSILSLSSMFAMDKDSHKIETLKQELALLKNEENYFILTVGAFCSATIAAAKHPNPNPNFSKYAIPLACPCTAFTSLLLHRSDTTEKIEIKLQSLKSNQQKK